MATINTSDLQLWFSHPTYIPGQRARVRGKSAAITAAAAGDIFRMDSSFPDIDDLTMPSVVGRQFRFKEHMGIGQSTVRRTFVNVSDVKEASGTFTCNFGVEDTPEQFFNHVLNDRGAGGTGRGRPMTVRAVFDINPGLVAGTGLAMVNGAAATGDNTLGFDTVTLDAFEIGDFFQIAGQATNYLILDITGSGAIMGAGGTFSISPALGADAADNAVITKQNREPNLDMIKDGNVSDYILSEFDYAPEIDGEVMGSFTLQSSGTGIQYIRS